MQLLYISCYQFSNEEGKIKALPAYGDQFWKKYLDVFDSVHVLGERVKDYLNNGMLTTLTNPLVTIDIIPGNTNPKDFIHDQEIKKILEVNIKNAEAVIIKPSSRKGMMAIRLAEKYHKPYMVELTGDLNLTLMMHPNLLKRMYGPYLHKRIVKAIKNAPFGLYVTEKYLQKVYPIAGKQCGASNVFVESISEDVLESRCRKISSMEMDDPLQIGLIGSYHDTRKGIDTAVQALADVCAQRPNTFLNILALGVEEDRKKWMQYAQQFGVQEHLKFPPSCDTTQKVLEWIDTQDIIILPSRSEGLPRCVVEAMSRGCPCITSDVCGMPELIQKKWLHAPGEAQRLAELILEMSESKNNMTDAAKENFKNAKRFLRSAINKRRNAFFTEFKEYCLSCKETERS